MYIKHKFCRKVIFVLKSTIIVLRAKPVYLIIFKEVKNEDLRRHVLNIKINGGCIRISVHVPSPVELVLNINVSNKFKRNKRVVTLFRDSSGISISDPVMPAFCNHP